jgi:hypothetical protein
MVAQQWDVLETNLVLVPAFPPLNPLAQWLEQVFRRQAGIALVFSPLALLAGLLAMFLTFWLFYALIYIMAGGLSAVLELVVSSKFKLGHFWRLVMAGVWMLLVVAGYWRRPASNMEPMPEANYVEWSPTLHGGGTAAGLILMAAYPGATAHLLRDLFQTGPRLVHGALALWRMVASFKAIDPAFCAPYLERLARAAGVVTWDDMQAVYGPEYVPTAVEQLRAIEGVVVLNKGISLTADLRRELRPLLVQEEVLATESVPSEPQP